MCFRATAPPNPLEFGDIEGDKDARSLFDARTRLLTVQASASAEASSESCELSRRIAWTLTFRRVS